MSYQLFTFLISKHLRLAKLEMFKNLHNFLTFGEVIKVFGLSILKKSEPLMYPPFLHLNVKLISNPSTPFPEPQKP